MKNKYVACGDAIHIPSMTGTRIMSAQDAVNLLNAYRKKRANDGGVGGPGRVWDAAKHIEAENLIRKLEGES